MFGAIIGTLAGPIIDRIIGPFLKLGEAYFNKQISMEELRARMVTALIESTTEVEKSHSETLAKTYASFMDAASKSRLLQVVWAAATMSQLLVLLWHQVGIPAFVYITGSSYPSSGSTVEWAYALVGACLGMGPLVLRTGPASGGGLIDRLKQAIKV